MTRTPFLLAQLSDTHIGASWLDADPAETLARTVQALCGLSPPVDAVVVTGDLADNGVDDEYELLVNLLAPINAQIYVLPGNRDDRTALARRFGLPGSRGEPVHYAVELGPIRLVVVDTTRPGADAGQLDSERLDWLAGELARFPDSPTVLAMHHPPLVTGAAAMDRIGIPGEERHALGVVLQRHAQVLRVVAGHVHRTITADIGGRAVLAIPSTYVQFELDLNAPDLVLGSGPPGFAVHIFSDGQLISHVELLG